MGAVGCYRHLSLLHPYIIVQLYVMYVCADEGGGGAHMDLHSKSVYMDINTCMYSVGVNLMCTEGGVCKIHHRLIVSKS